MAAKPMDNMKSYGLMNLVQGKSPAIQKDPYDMVMSWPHLLFREVVLFLIVLTIIMGMSILFNAPLEEMADPKNTPNPAKAPWYFLGLQEALSWGPPVLGGIVFPTVLAGLLIAVPYLDRSRDGIGVWFHPKRRTINILFTVGMVLWFGLIVVGTFLRGPSWEFFWFWEPWPIH
ncbi:MAG: menaquinol oxidoreductase [Nitrospirae bacterium CG18_big_fil_WC_8_21_14_2_50_70_55]|nr:menaquinol oxidoreductase [Deltaproteobacteria bacterium]OIP65043.1 MAG: hypothetical protein AUK30_05370 [Nitrospirae bacterium CG2_30_70_394]PIQ04330.1 MAG: menaquinol oxidoreductase [Nitrospirae bacterium CG18_big_fil_WC_8_21_14_2_50_70_55]PIU79076.1 MAG: menaquinol oxidoreductase [Nitrospirae bacterium CG06_land_8_20_14_3_00_70_43]PIW82432.1 MAG: menaquinol oxidoreductase [Nitrospirae bacterium CG_4_8_14_3_um_filter_70_85]PIX82113.1 MAG: menaquinol oxidoreductase [Nitrospirae bacterium 